MKKTYEAPYAELTRFETEDVLGISYTGTGTILVDKKPEAPAKDFGSVSLF